MLGFQSPFGGPPNPFSINTMLFKIDAIHEPTGNVREGIMTVNVPHTATELHARRLILEMAYQCGWRMRELNRIDNQPTEPAL